MSREKRKLISKAKKELQRGMKKAKIKWFHESQEKGLLVKH